MEEKQKYRLVTRSNFDGIINTALLKKLDMIDEVLYVHPKEIQDGTIHITQHDIVTNLPYVDTAHMAFDHRLDTNEYTRLNPHHALFGDAQSVSEVIYEYYGGKSVFGEALLPLIEAANRSKTAAFSKEEILNPQGWDQLIFITDPRTGLGRFREFRISNYALMQKLPDLCLHHPIEEILQDPDVAERIRLCHSYRHDFMMQLEQTTQIMDDIAVTDLTKETTIYPGNRFMIYARYPQVTRSIHLFGAKEPDKVVIAIGDSVFHRHKSDKLPAIHTLLKPYGGGGHSYAGTCQIPQHDVASVLDDILKKLNESAAYA